jgi:hypothetical protein
MSWLPVIAVVAGCFALKLAGTAVPARIVRTPRFAAISVLVPVALIAAVIAVQTVTVDHRFSLDARAAGLAVAAIAVWRRLPFVVVVLSAALTAALLRRL